MVLYKKNASDTQTSFGSKNCHSRQRVLHSCSSPARDQLIGSCRPCAHFAAPVHAAAVTRRRAIALSQQRPPVQDDLRPRRWSRPRASSRSDGSSHAAVQVSPTPRVNGRVGRVMAVRERVRSQTPRHTHEKNARLVLTASPRISPHQLTHLTAHVARARAPSPPPQHAERFLRPRRRCGERALPRSAAARPPRRA